MNWWAFFLLFGKAAHAAVNWELHGGDWAEGQCAERKSASPINLDAMDAPLTGASRFQYGYNLGFGFKVKNDADKIFLDFDGKDVGGIRLGQGSTYYPLKRIDFKAHSEHTFRGKTAELEMQLVHEAPNVAPVILSVLIDSKPSTIAAPASLLQRFASQKNKKAPTFTLLDKLLEGDLPEPMRDFQRVFVEEDLGVALGAFIDGGSFFEYSGAETLPPCMPATWLVRREVQVYSNLLPLLTHLQTIVPAGNYRTLMPFNERIVDIVSGRSLPDAFFMPDNREVLAKQWADDALGIAQAAHGFVQDVQLRLRNASTAFANSILGADAPAAPAVDASGAPVLPAVGTGAPPAAAVAGPVAVATGAPPAAATAVPPAAAVVPPAAAAVPPAALPVPAAV